MAAPLRLICAHYFAGSARSWAPLTTVLGDGFEIAAPDLAGFGGTSAPATPGLDGYVDDILALGGDGDWIAVGHSMGGKIALAVAARRPAGLKGLILIAPSPPTPEPMSEEDRQMTLNAFGDRAAAKAHLDEIAPGTLTPALFDQAVDDEVSVARSVWTWWLKTGSRLDISGSTQGLDLPTLVVTGDEDKVMGLKTPFGVAAGLVNAEVQVIRGGGHLVPLEQPGVVAEAIRGFLPSLHERS